MDMPFAQAELYLPKITATHFSTLNIRIANQNVLEKDSHCYAQREHGQNE